MQICGGFDEENDWPQKSFQCWMRSLNPYPYNCELTPLLSYNTMVSPLVFLFYVTVIVGDPGCLRNVTVMLGRQAS